MPGGAFLLFLTNFLSSRLAGGGVFALLGLSKASMASLKGSKRRSAFLLVALGTLLMIVPLAATSVNTGQAALTQFHTTQAAQDWLADTDEYDLVALKVNGEVVEVSVSGGHTVPPTDELIAAVAELIDRRLTVQLQVIPAQQQNLQVNQ